MAACTNDSSGSSSPSTASMTPSAASLTSPRRRRRRRLGHSHRVLIYTTCYNVIDGVTLTIRKIEQELLAAGHHVLILTTRSGDLRNTNLHQKHAHHPNRTVLFLDNSIPIPFLEDPNNPALQYHLGYSLSHDVTAKLKDFEPSLVHITCPDNLALHLIEYARTQELPLMGTYHSNIPDYMDHYPGMKWLKPLLATFFKHQYGFMQRLYVPTAHCCKHLQHAYTIMDRATTNLHVWGRGIDLKRFSPVHRSQAFRQSTLGLVDYGDGDSDGDNNDHQQQVVVCWVGRCVPEKRTDVFARVIRRLHARGVPVKPLVVGRGPSEDDVKHLPNVAFCGWLDGQDLSTAYASSDVFLFPSSVETFGNVSLEAAASGLPLVVDAKCSGHMIQDGGAKNGFACADEEAFFQATLELCLNAQLRKSCARASRQFSLQFETRTIVKKMLEHYADVTDEFYCEYGGHHSNRDEAYRDREGAFAAGSHPRPSFFIAVEFVFISAFRIFTALWTACAWLTSSIRKINRRRRPIGAAGGQHQQQAEEEHGLASTAMRTAVHKTSSSPKMVRADSVTMSLIEEGSASTSSCCGADHDDETSVTASIVETSSFSSAGSGSTAVEVTVPVSAPATASPPNSPAVSPFAAIGDSFVITALSTCIIGLIAFQCRVESSIRYRFHSFLSGKGAAVRLKRKNSRIISRDGGGSLSYDDGDAADECSDAASRQQDDTLKRRLRRSKT